MLWFDVGIDRYTANRREDSICAQLWFDVGIDRYTAIHIFNRHSSSCGLM